MTDEPPRELQRLVLDARSVTAPAHEALVEVSELLPVALKAVDEADLAEVRAFPGTFLSIAVESAVPIEQRRERYRRTLILRALQDVARGIRQSLEAAYLWNEIFALGSPIPPARFDETVANARVIANRADFPKLLSLVTPGLREPLGWEAELRSLIDVRNCLEHRAGIVGAKDTRGGEALELHLPTIQSWLIEPDGTEVLLNGPMLAERGGRLAVRVGRQTTTYQLGGRIEIDGAGAAAMAQACLLIAEDLRGKLPTR